MLFGDTPPLGLLPRYGRMLEVAIGTGLNLEHYPDGIALTEHRPQPDHAWTRPASGPRPRSSRRRAEQAAAAIIRQAEESATALTLHAESLRSAAQSDAEAAGGGSRTPSAGPSN